ncbi:MAG: helix-turn-helix domain-containing protein [Solirubrobacterales bacterium]
MNKPTVELTQAFNNPLRRRVFAAIRDNQPQDGEMDGLSPREMQRRWKDIPLSNISYHVRILVEANAIVCLREEPARGSVQHFYVVNPRVAGEQWVKLVFEIAAFSEGLET